MKKLLLSICLVIVAAFALSACGTKDPVVEEAQVGVNLEDKARDVTGQQGEDAQKADEMLDKPMD